MSEGSTTEIHARLVLDEDAEKAAEHLKEGFEGIGEKVHEVEHELGELLKTTLAVAAGFELDRGIESIKELGHEVMNAATESENAEKSIAGLLATTDKTGKSFEELTERAKEVQDQLETIGIRSGASSAAIDEAFELIAARSNKSTEEIVNLTDKMALAGKILPGGVGQIAAAWRDFESGMVRPRNALVQLMIQSHTVSGSMSQVARGLTQMMQTPEGQEKAFKMAEAAIDKMAEKAKDAPLSYNQLITSLKDIRELAFKEAGEPIIAALKGPLKDMREYFVKNREAIEQWARTAGDKVGKWAVEAATEMKEGFEYLQSHAEEIESAIKGGFAAAKAVVEFILTHKEELAMAFGANKAMQLGSAIAGVGSLGGMVPGAGAIASLGTAALASAGGLIALTAAAGSLYLAYIEWQKLMNITGGGKSDADMNREARSKAIQADVEAGNITDTRRLTDAAVDANEITREYADSLVQSAKATADVNRQIDAINNHGASLKHLDIAGGDDPVQVAKDFERAYHLAGLSMRDTSKKLLIAQLGAHREIMDAMVNVAPEYLDTARRLADDIAKFNPAVADALKAKIAGASGTGTREAVSVLPPINFYGPISIHQDFRDQDPDRVVAVMRKDLVHSAGARIQSRGAIGFGM
jgi:hypothetical protein